MSTSTNFDTLSLFVAALDEVNAQERIVEIRRRRLNELRRNPEIPASSIRMFERSLSEGESSLRYARRKYAERAREVRVYKLDGTFVGYQNDESRSLAEAGTNEAAYENQMREYERQNEAVAAALYECGHLDF